MWLAAAIPLMLIAGATAVLVRTVPPLPGLLVAYGRKMPTMLSGPPEILYVGEGLNSSVAVSQFPGGVTSYHNAGKIQASSLPQDMRLQRMLGHLTTLAPRQATSVLVIGCGAGVTAGAVSVDPTVEKLTIAEIEPLVPRVVSTYFGEYNHHVDHESENADRPRRRTALPADDGSEVRRDHLRPARPVGQGRRGALHQRVLGAREAAPQSGRRRHGVRAALREQSRSGEERDRDVLRGVSQRRDLRQRVHGRGLRHGAARAARAGSD